MKRHLKRMSADVMAFCMTAAMAVPFGNSLTADAGLYAPGDINGDGTVSSADAAVLQGYLFGRCDITRYGAADLDHDKAITMADLSRLSKYLGGLMTLPSASNDIAMSNMESRSYVMHNYKTNATSTYTLDADVDISSENGISTYADNVDDRVIATDTSVVQVTSGGTGFIVGDHVIATAAHCVFNSQTGKFLNNLKIVVRGRPNAGVSQELCTCQIVEAHVPRSYYTGSNISETDKNDSRYDYALLYVEEDLSEYGIFNLGLPSDEFMDSQTTVTTIGYPGDTASNPHAGNKLLYKSDGAVLNISRYNASLFDHQIATSSYVSGGNSGGPIYMTINFGSDEFHTVVGISTSVGYMTRNNDDDFVKTTFGVRVTPSLLEFYNNNNNNNNIGSSVN